jgi:hypothetical protein
MSGLKAKDIFITVKIPCPNKEPSSDQKIPYDIRLSDLIEAVGEYMQTPDVALFDPDLTE